MTYTVLSVEWDVKLYYAHVYIKRKVNYFKQIARKHSSVYKTMSISSGITKMLVLILTFTVEVFRQQVGVVV